MDNILKCCICGFENKDSILSHIRNAHHLSAKEYRKKYNFPLRSAWVLKDDKSIEEFKKIGKRNAIFLKGKPGRAKLNKWSRKFDKCISCGSTDRKHNSNGLCARCGRRIKVKQRTLSRNLKIMNNGTEGDDYIICQICKKPYKNLTDYGHLKEHKITSKEYKKLFPNAKTSCKKSTMAQSIGVTNCLNNS